MRVMILGADAPIVPRVLKYMAEGEMPNLRSLVEAGVFAENCLVPFPTITPPNWATIVTGAWPGTHSVTCFHMHKPGSPLDQVYPAFDSNDVQAEFLWEAAARAGKRSIVLNYPTSWPPRGGDWLIQVAGAGLAPNEWRLHPKRTSPWDIACDLCASQLFATEEYPLGTVVEAQAPTDWANLPEGAMVEYRLPLAFRAALGDPQPVCWWGLVSSDGNGPRLAIYASKQDSEPMSLLKPGEWSAKLLYEFGFPQGPRRGVFKFKLLELSPDGKTLKLFLSPICALDGYHKPEALADELAGLAPMPLPGFGVDELNLGWIDEDTFAEMLWEGHMWLADAADYLLGNKPWDLFVMHLHSPDWMYHSIATSLDPVTEPASEARERAERLEREFHRAWDAMLGKILRHAAEDVLVAVVSDHGAKASGQHVPVNRILQEAGLLAMEDTPQGPRVVWEKTQAFAQRSSYVYVNLAGRDPQGIVAPDEYEHVRDAVITALLSYRDPKLGLCPFSMVLRREDARPLGIYGENIGDVVFAVRGEFDGQHGDHLPTATWGLGDLRGLLILKGPGVRQNYKMQRTAWITDLVPTICYLAEWPIPQHAEGAILYQALDNPDTKTDELKRLRRNYQNLRRAYAAETSLTHSYHDVAAESLGEEL